MEDSYTLRKYILAKYHKKVNKLYNMIENSDSEEIQEKLDKLDSRGYSFNRHILDELASTAEGGNYHQTAGVFYDYIEKKFPRT